MRKEELRKLRALPATKTILEKGKKYTKKREMSYLSNGYRTVIIPEYELLIRVQNLKGFIKIAIFFPEWIRKDIRTPRYEVFLNPSGEEWITRELDESGNEQRWLSAMIINLEGVRFYGYYHSDSYKKIYMNQDAKDTINSLKTSSESAKGIWRVQKWQQEIKDNRTLLKEQKEKAPWDADMKLIPEITDGFIEWMRKDVASEYYIFYKYSKKGADTGYCSRCKRQVKIKNPKANMETKCPLCKAEATFKPDGRIQTLSTYNYYGEIIQKFKGGIVIRKFRQYQYYRNTGFDNPHIVTEEMRRLMFFDNGTIKKYEMGMYKNKEYRWILDKDYITIDTEYYGGRRIKLYKRNLGVLKNHSMLKHSSIDLWDTLPTSTAKYLAIEKGNPAVEMLARIGMFRLARGLIQINYDSKLLNEDATELSKMLKIDNARLKRLKEMDGNIHMLKWMQLEKMHNTVWPDNMIKDLGNANITTSGFNFLPIPIKFVKCYNYLKKQSEIIDDTLKQTLTTWQDYINMAEQLKMNTKLDQIAKPKNIKRAHDELVLINKSKGLEKQAKALEKKWPKVNKQLPKLKKFEFTSGEYTILAPNNILDIVKEGVILSHCVHTCDYYFERIQTDESYLFFLRKSNSPDMPWYTLEVEPSGNIRQKRTTGDNQNPDFDKALGFLKKWQKFFKKQLTEEEKELGKKADKLRKENYAELRKNGNKVWHGKLAGQLLADVLEADFMEAI